MHKCWPLAVFFLLALFSSVTAVGIAPASMTLTLQPGTQQSLTYYAYTSGDREVEVEAYVEATILQNVKILQSPKFTVPPNGVLKPFTVTFTTPRNLPAGNYDVYVGVREATNSVAEGLTARVASQSVLHIENPNGSARLVMSMAAANISMAGQPAYFYIKAENPTPSAIGPVSGELVISNSGNNEVYRTPLQSISKIQPGGSARITGTWSGTKVGRYTAVATVNYAGQTDSAAAEMQVGRQSVEILRINVTQKENIVLISTEVKNTWAEPMNVSAEVMGYYKGDLIGQGTSSTVKLAPEETAVLDTSVDIKEWRAEELDFDVLVLYDGHTTQQSVTAEGYFPEQYQAPPLGAFLGSKADLKTKSAYIIAVLLIIIVLILYRIYTEDRRFGR